MAFNLRDVYCFYTSAPPKTTTKNRGGGGGEEETLREFVKGCLNLYHSVQIFNLRDASVLSPAQNRHVESCRKEGVGV